MKDNDDELTLVIVRDMWLTGIDAPSMHTLHIDKPMKGHNLMQAIARVNRDYLKVIVKRFLRQYAIRRLCNYSPLKRC